MSEKKMKAMRRIIRMRLNQSNLRIETVHVKNVETGAVEARGFKKVCNDFKKAI